MDVTREDQVNTGITRVVQTLGGVDILVCNVGIQIISPVEALSLADRQRVLAVHLDGAFLATRAAAPYVYAGVAVASFMWGPCIPRRPRS